MSALTWRCSVLDAPRRAQPMPRARDLATQRVPFRCGRGSATHICASEAQRLQRRARRVWSERAAGRAAPGGGRGGPPHGADVALRQNLRAVSDAEAMVAGAVPARHTASDDEQGGHDPPTRAERVNDGPYDPDRRIRLKSGAHHAQRHA